MLILWIRKRKAEAQKIVNQPEDISFQEHDDIMKKFRFAHPDVNVMNTRDILTEEGNLLAHIDRVKLASHSQN
jgi:hypothetical protein